MYPLQRDNGLDSRPEDYSQRIEKLEVYVRRLGGDPQLIEQIVESGEANFKESSTYCPMTEARPKHQTSWMKRTEVPIDEQSGLVEHGEQVTYIEAYVPLWVSAFAQNAADNTIPDQCGTAGVA